MRESFTSVDLLKRWRAHIADVYQRRGRALIYSEHEAHSMQTCHGCGASGELAEKGLCQTCSGIYSMLVTAPTKPARLVWHCCGCYGYSIPWGDWMASGLWPYGRDVAQGLCPTDRYIRLFLS